MKVLTLHQPWASLVALGVKTIETRSWSTKYRGPLAIHAGAKYPNFDAASILWPHGVDRVFQMHASQGCEEGLPRGAIVATCTLVDVVPMKAHTDSTTDHLPHLLVGTRNDRDRLLLCRPTEGWHSTGGDIYDHFEWATEIVTDQRPYGDFIPGRFAWLLADVVPVDPPVPFKGGQGLTKSWEPAAA